MGAQGIVWARQVRQDRIAEAERAYVDAQDELDAWETAHELEYKGHFHRSEFRELAELDAQWQALVDERDAARDEYLRLRETPSW